MVPKGILFSSYLPVQNVPSLSNNSKEAAVPETSNSVSTSTSISTPSTTSAAIAVQSDFAPFVGGVLTDRLIDEIGVLQSRLTESRLESEHKRLRVQITGVDGTPIYCDGSLKNAGRNRDDQILLDFDYGSSDGFPLSSLNIEIRLGGVKVQQFNIDDLYISFAGLYDEENRMEYIHFNHDITPPPNGSGPVAQVHGRIGPLPLGWGLRNTGDEDGMVLTDFLELVSDENNDLTPQTLVIIGLVFDEKAISGIMSLVNIRDMT
ncbi:hypothetical protein FRACYDRAFT_271141 [Fragilariopsis cylindrus CCMP1102]|uniref:Uncharacterized protein n=1 Tax=Fragilariopsis cylindrus CCMP1102 TaxID=635003 RepID=A0A1E7EWL0_9STRA|nr:hypothetical protein FRACYDRAFT_271141 [Fragilariopsis cylindrus CCMP1102]|eukprot:OEU10418.1 hypothetical protein FRACYDRAFT_271141 [Fragilariopsis cylindrus CCMP1102]